MCGRFAASSSAEDLVEFFEIDEVVEPLPAPSYNIAPTSSIAAVFTSVGEASAQRRLAAVRWGLVPSWAKDPDHGSRLINARVETVAEKPSFRAALARRRCLIPADGYFEWLPRTSAEGKVTKQPYFIAPHDGRPLAMAGLYEYWRGPDHSWLTTATIITTDATDELGLLHDRMPMVVEPRNWGAWLDPEVRAPVTELLTAPVGAVRFYPVSQAVNRVGNDGPQLLEPVELSE